ncbi:MAG: LysR family transcriptional regulator [Chloroflexota bacterium]
MEIGQLVAFERAAREGSFTAAAESLSLTQPAVSSRIASLERELGGQLFERGGKRLALTPLGRSILPYAEKVLHATADARAAAQLHHEGRLGSVSIAALDTLGVAMLPEPMAGFHTAHPAVDFTIRYRIKQQIINLLYDGRVTLGLTAAPLWDRGIRTLAHFRNPIRAVVAATHPLAVRDNLRMYDLQQYPIYRSTLSPTATALVQDLALQAQRGTGEGAIFMPAIMAAPMLLEGQGVTFLPQALVAKQVSAGQLVFLDVLDMPTIHTEPLLVALADREIDAPNATFVRFFCEHWASMRVDGASEKPD